MGGKGQLSRERRPHSARKRSGIIPLPSGFIVEWLNRLEMDIELRLILIFSHQALLVEEMAGGSPRRTSVKIFSQHHLDHSTTISIPCICLF